MIRYVERMTLEIILYYRIKIKPFLRVYGSKRIKYFPHENTLVQKNVTMLYVIDSA